MFVVVTLLAAILLAADLYVFKGIRSLAKNITRNWIKKAIYWVYWVWSIFLIVATVLLIANFQNISVQILESKSFWLPFTCIALFLLNILPKLTFLIFHLIEDIIWLGTKGISKIKPKSKPAGKPISRSTFLSQLGLILAGIQFSWFFYGFTKGKFNFRVLEESLAFDKLPEAFHGLKIVQISDLHLGSFYEHFNEVERGIDLVNSLNPDVIFFTGDLVNNYSWEIDGWEGILSKLKAKHGVYSIMGNHDYGDYGYFASEEDKQKSVSEVKSRQQEFGFNLLNNQLVKLQKDGEYIELIGVENWGKTSRTNPGNLAEALKESRQESFKILLSHDPTHWEEEVKDKTDIDLTLSGHTHGMQFGVEIPGFRWSPAQYLYTYWAGLYQTANQSLYVNRGFGNTIAPGRVGMKPEITVINLLKKT